MILKGSANLIFFLSSNNTTVKSFVYSAIVFVHKDMSYYTFTDLFMPDKSEFIA